MALFKGRSIFTFLSIVGLASLLAGCAAPGPVRRAEPVKGNPAFWNSIYYMGTSGEVGHHMVAEARATCGEPWGDHGVEIAHGRLPPGLNLSGSSIEGTPRQPGKWKVTVRFTGPTCRGKDYPDKNVYVTFYIKGFAPRKVR